MNTHLSALGDRYFHTQHTYDPYNATMLGLSEFDHLSGDPSREASAGAAAALAVIGREVAAIDTTTLEQNELVDHAVLTVLVRGAQEDAEHCLWAANASAKGYVSRQALVFQAVPAMTLTTPGGESYLERLAGLSTFFSRLGDRYLQEAADGRIATALGVVDSIEQLEGSLRESLDRDPLLTPAAGNPAVREAARKIIETDIRPAMVALAERLRSELLPGARADDAVGIQNVPGGRSGYRAAVARHTTTNLSPEDIHQIGLDTLEAMKPEWSAVGARALGETDFATIIHRMRTDLTLRFETSEQIVAVAQAALDRANAARPRYFADYDITECTIEQISPLDAEHSALAYYRPPAMDGSRPGAHCLLATEPQTRYRFEYEALAFHESVPGHHLQLAMAQKLDIPRYRRSLDVEACSFNEGWGLYAEQFADEIGLYSDDLSRLGMLSMRSLRACRLVIDTGIHHYGWSRQQAVEFMWSNTATTESNARSEVDRYIAWPGQALAYLIGAREIKRLRLEAEHALGEKFSVAAFHDIVLGNGAVPLTVLANNVEAWQRTTQSHP